MTLYFVDTFTEDLSSVPAEEPTVEDASPGQLPLHDVPGPAAEDLLPSPLPTDEHPVPDSVDALPVPEQEDELPLTPLSVPTLPPAKRRLKAKKKKKPVSVSVSRKRRRTPSPVPSPAKSPIPVTRIFRNPETDGFMALAKLIRKSKRIREQGMK